MRICFQSTDINGQKSPVQYVDPGNRALLQLPEHKVHVWLDDSGGPPNRSRLIPMVGEEGKANEAVGVTRTAIEFHNGLDDPRLDLFWVEQPSARNIQEPRKGVGTSSEQDLSHLDEPKTDNQ